MAEVNVCLSGWYKGYLARDKAQQVNLMNIMLHFDQDVIVTMSFCLYILLQGVFPANFVHLKDVVIGKQG